MSDVYTSPQEISRFNRLSQEWWDVEGGMRLLHLLNPVRLEWIRNQTGLALSPPIFNVQTSSRPLQGLKILDIGCGGGILCEPLARMGADVMGIDPAQDLIEVARHHAIEGDLRIEYRSQPVEDISPLENHFDIICALEILEHAPNPARIIQHACRLLKEGGLFFISTLNRTLKSYFLAIVGAEYILRWVPLHTHQWEKFITPSEMKKMLEEAGAACLAQTGLAYHPLTRKWNTTEDMGVNYILCARKYGRQETLMK